MLRKRVFAGAILALSLFALPVTASAVPVCVGNACTMVPGDTASPVQQLTTYGFNESVFGNASFTHNYFFDYNPTIITTASAVDLQLGSVVGFTSLIVSWIGPDSIVNQSWDAVANPNVAFPLDLSDGPGLYTLRIEGDPVETATLTAYAGALTTGENANETPIPGAVLLFGSVLAGGVGLMRRRRSIAQAA